jgi:hypothetical protein
MKKIDINTMTPTEILQEISTLPRTQSELKQLQDIQLFEELFTLTGGKIEIIKRGKNKGKNKYVAPAEYKYDRDDVYKILTGLRREDIVSVKTLLGADFFFRTLDLTGEDSYLNLTTPTEIYRKKLYRWYWASFAFNPPTQIVDTISKSPLWIKLYNELLEKAKEVHKEEGFFEIDDYNKYHFELQPQIDIEKDLQNNLEI